MIVLHTIKGNGWSKSAGQVGSHSRGLTAEELEAVSYTHLLGKRIRAVSQNRDAAALCGVNVHTTYGIAFGLGTAALAIAGACMASFYLVSPSVGNVFGTKSFMIVVLGGLGSIPGAIIGGLIFGLIEQVGAQFITSTMASMLSFILFLIVLVIKPDGLLGKKK